MSDGLTRQDLRQMADDILARVGERFDALHARGNERHSENVDRLDGINDRLDELNGRTRKAENAIATQEDRWQRLDKATHLTGASQGSSTEAGVKGDWKVLVGVGSMIGGLLYGLWQAIKAIAKP